MAKFGFDVAEVEVNAPVSYDPVPEGEYVLKALEAEEKDTSAGTGSYIKVKFEITKGEYAGRWIWSNFNINNPSEKAQRIGRQQLVAWATACGKPDADDTDKLLEKSFKAAVSIEAGKDGYKDSNRIKAFLFDTAEPAKSAPKPTAAKPVASAKPSASANPWD
jgi:hypothetical protein